VLLNDVELYRGEVPQGCGNQIFDYCHEIQLVQQQSTQSGVSSQSSRAVAALASPKVSATPHSAVSGMSPAHRTASVVVVKQFRLLLNFCFFLPPMKRCVYSSDSVRGCVFLCVHNISKSYERILTKVFGEVERGQETYQLDFGSNLMTPSPSLPQFFTSIMHL